MRILLVGINYAPDLIGVAKYNTELCEALAAHGHEVRVVTAPPYYPEWRVPEPYRGFRYRSETLNGVSIKRTPIYTPEVPTGAKRLVHHASFTLSSLWPVVSTSVRWRPDVVFAVAPSLMSAAVPGWIAARIGAFSWLHLQDFEVDAAFDLGLLSNRRLRAPMVAMERLILRSFDSVSTISPQMLHRLITKGVDRDKVREVRNWTDVQKISPGQACPRFRKDVLALDSSDFVCLYSGTMSNKQGLDLIIDAARSVGNTNSKIRFVLCGDGPHKEQLQQLAGGLTNVSFLGLQSSENFAELLKAADVHLIPQKAEAADLVLPSKLGGILASGRPVIVMANPGTGLAEEIGQGGIVIPPGDAGGLAEAIATLAGNAALCRTLGEEARSIAVARWDKATIISTVERTMLAQHQRRQGLSPTAAELATLNAKDRNAR
ncbi:WcaI family glycosyltransferase [Bradyrhizobium symbiodeficiens]|uniref:WcaI family glycosyltransferase n=1 Tax=Bradyrhizobium symbiodeficiens TaxID=1404367 RepID=UPI0030D413A4